MSWLLKTVVFKLLKEALFSLFGRLPWAVLVERLVSRVAIAGLRKLASMTTNTLDDETVEDVIKSLRRPDLPEVK